MHRGMAPDQQPLPVTAVGHTWESFPGSNYQGYIEAPLAGGDNSPSVDVLLHGVRGSQGHRPGGSRYAGLRPPDHHGGPASWGVRLAGLWPGVPAASNARPYPKVYWAAPGHPGINPSGVLHMPVPALHPEYIVRYQVLSGRVKTGCPNIPAHKSKYCSLHKEILACLDWSHGGGGVRPRVRRPETMLRICVSWNKGRCMYPGHAYLHICWEHMARDCSATPANSEYKPALPAGLSHFQIGHFCPPRCCPPMATDVTTWGMKNVADVLGELIVGWLLLVLL